MTAVTSAYANMLNSAKKAKYEGRDSIEYFIKSGTGSEAYKLTSRGVECKENVAGMTLIFLCMALIKLNSKSQVNSDNMVLVLKSHLNGLMKMRTSTGVPLCVVEEEEGVMFAGEGMALRFLNALIIIESLLIAKLKRDGEYLKDAWGLYSSMDLVVYLELPVLMDGVLDEAERTGYAKAIEASDNKSRYYKVRKQASDLVRVTVKDVKKEAGMTVMKLFLFLLYTSAVIHFTMKFDEYYDQED